MPEVLPYVVAVALTVAGWFAGRNRFLAKQMRTMATVYEDLVKDLRSEIDRLKAEVEELRTLLSEKSPAQKTRSRVVAK